MTSLRLSPIRPMIMHSILFEATATTATYTLSLHDALPISDVQAVHAIEQEVFSDPWSTQDFRDCLASDRSEEHTSELQSRRDLVCRLLLEKKNPTTLAIQLRSCYKRVSNIGHEIHTCQCDS